MLKQQCLPYQDNIYIFKIIISAQSDDITFFSCNIILCSNSFKVDVVQPVFLKEPFNAESCCQEFPVQ